MAKILFLEDDLQVSEELTKFLRQEKHIVDPLYSCADAEAYLKRFEYDLLILDWQLPDGSGLELCKQLRKNDCATPILMLTGKSEVSDRTFGLDSGADDYVVKPFSAEELSARIRALLRRIDESEKSVSSYADISLDAAARTVFVGGTQVQLRSREFALLQCLLERTETTVSHQILRNTVWWDEDNVERNTINAMTARLRKKLQEAGSHVQIDAMAGEGFCLRKKEVSDT